jgi:hypothetical protein
VGHCTVSYFYNLLGTHLSETDVGLIFLVGAGCYVLSGPVVGAVSDR